MIETIRQGLQAEGITVSISKLCLWSGVPRRSVYYKPVKSAPKLQEHWVAPVKAMIEENPSFGYRTVAHLLRFNKNTVQRIFQLKGWQVCKRPVGFRPRIQSLPSVAKAPNERWSTDMFRVWAGRNGWKTMALVDRLPHPGVAGLSSIAKREIEDGRVGARAGAVRAVRHAGPGADTVPTSLGQRLGVHQPQLPTLVRSYGLRQEFITPYSPEQNGLVERVIRTLKEQYVHRHRFESLQHASRVIGDWIHFYNHRRPHQALNMRTPR